MGRFATEPSSSDRRSTLKVLWVTKRVPDPEAGDVSAFELGCLQRALEQHDVRLMVTSLPSGEVDTDIGERTVAVEGSSVALTPAPTQHWGRAIKFLLRGPVNPRLRGSRTHALRELVEDRIERYSIDLVHITGSDLAPLASAAPVPVALLVTDVQPVVPPPGPAHPARRAWRAIVRRRRLMWSRRWYGRADGLACLNHRDRASLEALVDGSREIRTVDSPEALLDWWRNTERSAKRRRPAVSSHPKRTEAGIASASEQLNATVVVCTRDRPDLLRQTLPAYAASVARVSGAELLIVEQGNPGAQQVCESLGIDARIVHDPGRGAARARNLGVEAASGTVVLFSDDDCFVPDAWVEQHLDASRRQGVVASCGLVEGLSRFAEGADPVGRRVLHRSGSPPWVVGHSANMAVRRHTFLEVGGFDERLGPGTPGGYISEDADLIARLLRAGGSIASGVGEPVHHLPWRDVNENVRNIRAYERGAGAWIGKLAREDVRSARPYLRQRLWLLAERVHRTPGIRNEPVTVMLTLGAFVKGLVHGWRLGPWEAGANRQPARTRHQLS